jgi:hypothetical protein
MKTGDDESTTSGTGLTVCETQFEITRLSVLQRTLSPWESLVGIALSFSLIGERDTVTACVSLRMGILISAQQRTVATQSRRDGTPSVVKKPNGNCPPHLAKFNHPLSTRVEETSQNTTLL